LPTYLVRDNDRAYGQAFQRGIRAMGIRDRPISPRSPWQNPYAERLIGTLRRECLDQVLIVGGRHLRRMLASYSSYYNESRTHLALEKDAPLRRATQRCGAIITTPILSGLHHRYARIWFSGRTGGAAAFYLPPYSPDLNPIEQVFSKLTGILILIVPRLLSFIVAIYLIIVRLIGLNSIHHFIRWQESPSPRANFRACVGIGGRDH
jgi:transposase